MSMVQSWGHVGRGVKYGHRDMSYGSMPAAAHMRGARVVASLVSSNALHSINSF